MENKITIREKNKYQKELAKLEKDLEIAIEEKKEAASHGDFSENEDYHKAKNDIDNLNGRILELKEKLSLPLADRVSNRIELGSTILLIIKDSADGKELFNKKLDIVNYEDNLPSDGVISVRSPLIRELEGKSSFNDYRLCKDGTSKFFSVQVIEE